MVGTTMSATNGNSANDNNSKGLDVLKPRAAWLAKRKAENKDGNFSQMHYARQGVITEEMAVCRRGAKRLHRNWSATKSPAGA